jgi:phosphate transport system protein
VGDYKPQTKRKKQHTMSIHLQREIEKLKKQLLSLCGIVEGQVRLAVRSFLERDDKLAQDVEHQDAEINRREVEVEEECLKILALHQPVACNLRFIIAVMKINNDLERIGDLAVNIAHKAASYVAEVPLQIPFDLAGMADKTQSMLLDSIDALINMDAKLAKAVCTRDDEIDRLKHEIRVLIEYQIQQDTEQLHALMLFLAVARNLERIADCATNIAEDVIYMAEGKIIRHNNKNFDPPGRIAK